MWKKPTLQTPLGSASLRAANEWMDLFYGKAPWLLEAGVHSLNLPSSIVGELARLLTVELEGSVSGSARADYLHAQMATVLPRLRTQCEYALAAGGLVMKPYVDGTHIAVEFIKANSFIPTAFDGAGQLTGAVFIQQLQQENGFYTRLEQHVLEKDGYTVENKAFFSASQHHLGAEVPLSSVAFWAQLAPIQRIVCADGSPLRTPLFAYFALPFANAQSADCPLGGAVYSRAVDLIEQADRQYTRILWEYEGSELAIDASMGAVQIENGDMRLPRTKQRLFRELGIDKGDGGDLYSVFSPAIRDESLFNGLNNLLKRIEFACYLSFGTLSDPQTVDKTAEEIKMSRQRSYSAVCDLQKSLKQALLQLVAAMDIYASLYALAPAGAQEAVFSFGDAVTFDTEKEREAMRQDCQNGAAAWWEYRVKFYGETEETARLRTKEVSGKQHET